MFKLKKILGAGVLGAFLIGILAVFGASFGSSQEMGSSSKDVSIASEFTIHSEILNEDRKIVVALPEGYEENDAKYPVLYVLDGMQNLWHVVGSVEILTRNGEMPPVIIVGIVTPNPNYRMRDFTPSQIVEVKESGGAVKFLNFIESEVIPYIDSHYKTHPYRVLEGHSLGGLFTANTLIEKPDLFDAHIIMSPALWWNKEEVTEKAKIFFPSKSHLEKSVFLSIGTNDGWGMRQELKRFVNVIENNQPEGFHWAYQEMDDEGHMSAPLLINYFGLKHIFSDLKTPDELWKSFDSSKFIAHEERIISKYGPAAKQSEENYVTLGYGLIEKENYSGAITVFKRHAEAYPLWHTGYRFLGMAYEKNGDFEKALEAYTAAFQLAEKYEDPIKVQFQESIERVKGLLEKSN